MRQTPTLETLDRISRRDLPVGRAFTRLFGGRGRRKRLHPRRRDDDHEADQKQDDRDG